MGQGMLGKPHLAAPLFSVLLPTHNRADVLEAAIRSVLAQTLEDFELFVVGDGCTDHSKDVVAGMQDGRIRWFDLPKAPHFGYANRNRALREARGTYVAYMADDDLWFPDHLELLAGALENSDFELAYTLPLWIAPDGGLAPLDFDLNDPDTRDTFLGMQRNAIPCNCVAHRRDCLDRYGYWNEDLPACGDWDLWARIIRGGGRRNVGVVRVPSGLHFRAIWRTEANAGPPELRVWNAMHKVPGALPSTMRLAGPDGASQQQAVWKSLVESPDWIRNLRESLPYAWSRFSCRGPDD
jgi:glycosyltransferase involved in cell wall biosynthesis